MKRGWLFSVLVGLALSGCNLAGDITPPPGASPPAAPPLGTEAPAANAVAPPATSPDRAAGRSIYLQRCAPCHGEDGLGDGEQAADLPVSPSPLGDPALAAENSPADWYQVVTEGRMDRFMPPFGSLTDQERWNVVGYALTLSEPQGADSAEALYLRQCADCHGSNGGGAGSGPSLIEPATAATRSRAEVRRVIAEGAGQAMPAFGQDLEEAELLALAYYVQQLALAPVGGESLQAEGSGSEEAAAASAAITGFVLDGATNQPVSGQVEVTLHGFDGQQRVLQREATIEDGEPYSFEELETTAGRLFMVSAEYEGVVYSSEVVHLDPGTGAQEIPLVVYESTNDPSDVRAPRLHLLVDKANEGALRAVELWVLVNTGDRTIAPAAGGGGIEIKLPVGADNLRFEDSLLAERYQAIEGGFRLRPPLRPGGDGAQVVFSFDLPAAGDAEFKQLITVPVEAITILIVEDGPRVSGPGVIDRGIREAGGQRLRQYDLGPIDAGEELALTLEGTPFWRSLVPRSLGGAWLVGIVALGIVVGAIAWWYWPWITGKEPGQLEESEETSAVGADRRQRLLVAIAELDEAYEQGDVADAPYRRRRRELKQQLIELMQKEDD